jgi:hypothetical protein
MLGFPLGEHFGPKLEDCSHTPVDGDHSAVSSLGLALPNGDSPFDHVYLIPAQHPNFRIPHAGIQRQHDSSIQRSRSTLSAFMQKPRFFVLCQRPADIFPDLEHFDVGL